MTENEFNSLLKEAGNKDLLPFDKDEIIWNSNAEVYCQFDYDIQRKAVLECNSEAEVLDILNEMGNSL
ncbi:MAG: hypothetical protein VSS75_014110 [Candidatus Parabeggiatoa sp.]|nr:hypothetical protein [Candidatus Parabeggiatoa sp.]